MFPGPFATRAKGFLGRSFINKRLEHHLHQDVFTVKCKWWLNCLDALLMVSSRF
jgi:hypothetical protein